MTVKVVEKVRPSGVLDDRLLRREIEIGRRVVEAGYGQGKSVVSR